MGRPFDVFSALRLKTIDHLWRVFSLESRKMVALQINRGNELLTWRYWTVIQSLMGI